MLLVYTTGKSKGYVKRGQVSETDTASVADPFAHGEATVGAGDEDGSVSRRERVLEFLGIRN